MTHPTAATLRLIAADVRRLGHPAIADRIEAEAVTVARMEVSLDELYRDAAEQDDIDRELAEAARVGVAAGRVIPLRRAWR